VSAMGLAGSVTAGEASSGSGFSGGSDSGMAGSVIAAANAPDNGYYGPDSGYSSFLATLQAEIAAIIAGGPFQDGSMAGNNYGSSSIAPNLNAMINGGFAGTI
jgi:hypothetical protein